MPIVRFAYGCSVSARGRGDPPPDPPPDAGLYLDGEWSPTWPSTILDWPDKDVPGDPAKAAREICASFRAAQAGCRVEVGCGAGIGRTGTALACMAVVHGVAESKAVAWVRLLYHADAVETGSQREWISWFAQHAEELNPTWPAEGGMPAPWLASFVNFVCLLYHEARNVRFLIRAGHIPEGGFASLVSLPTGREKAWTKIGDVRQLAGAAPTPSGVARVFEDRFHASLDQLTNLFKHEEWRHSKVGGNAWARIAESVIELRDALGAKDPMRASRLVETIPKMCHNTGCVGDKLRSLNAWP